MKSITFKQFSTALCKFREDWTTSEFWMNPVARRTRVDKLLSDFGTMRGDISEIESAGLGLRATLIEYKMRRSLMVQSGQAIL